MPDPLINDDTLTDLASAPKKSRTDEGEVEERSINDVITADQYAASRVAGRAVPWGLRIARTKPPGADGHQG